MLWTLFPQVGGGGEGGGQDPTFLVVPNLKSKIFSGGEGGGGSSSFSTHAFHIHTHAIQIRIVALCVSKSATNKAMTLFF